MRSQDWGRPRLGSGGVGLGAGFRCSGGSGVEAATESGVSSSQGGGWRHLQNAALLLEAGPGFLRPLCALECGERRLNSERHTPLHHPAPAEPSPSSEANPPPQTPAPHAPAAGPLPAWRAWPPATPVVSSRGSKECQSPASPTSRRASAGPQDPTPPLLGCQDPTYARLSLPSALRI